MKALRILLWLQLLMAAVAVFWAWGVLFKGATGFDFYSGCIRELHKVQQTPGYQAPPEIRGLSQSNMVESLQGWALESAHLGGWCFFVAIGLVVISGGELWLLHRSRPGREPKQDDHTTT